MATAGGGLVETELTTSSPTSSQEFLASKEVLVQLRVTLPEHLGESGDEEQILEYVQSNLDTDRWIAKADFVIPDQLEQLILDKKNLLTEPSSQDSQEPSSQESTASSVDSAPTSLGPFLGKVDFAIQSILESHGEDMRHWVEIMKIVDAEVKEFGRILTPSRVGRSNHGKDFYQMTEYLNERISAYVEHRVPRNAELDVDDELIGLLTDCINEQATRYMQSEFWPFKVESQEPASQESSQDPSSQDSQEPSSQDSQEPASQESDPAVVFDDYGKKMTPNDYDSDEYDEDYLSACPFCNRDGICEAVEGQGVGDVFYVDDWTCRRCYKFLIFSGMEEVDHTGEEEDCERRANWLKHSGIMKPVALLVTFAWSKDVDGEYKEVARQDVRVDLADYMDEYFAYKSDPDAFADMSDWIEGLCGYPGYGGDGDIEQNWVELFQ